MAKDGTKTIITPWGSSGWAVLKGEETIKGKPTGKKSMQLLLEGPALETMKAHVEEFIGDNVPAKKAKAVKRPFKTNKDGKVFIKAVTYAFEKGTRDEKRVAVSNAKGEPVKRLVEIGNGSVVRLKVTMEMTEYEGEGFVKFWLNGVQIKKLETYVAGGGFEADEDDDGWTGDEFDGDGDDPGYEPEDRGPDGSDF